MGTCVLPSSRLQRRADASVPSHAERRQFSSGRISTRRMTSRCQTSNPRSGPTRHGCMSASPRVRLSRDALRTVEIQLGTTGRHAFGKEVQTWWHLDACKCAPEPRGWAHQVKAVPGVVGVVASWEDRIARERRTRGPRPFVFADIVPHYRLSVGNVLILVPPGPLARLGYNLQRRWVDKDLTNGPRTGCQHSARRRTAHTQPGGQRHWSGRSARRGVERPAAARNLFTQAAALNQPRRCRCWRRGWASATGLSLVAFDGSGARLNSMAVDGAASVVCF